MENKSRREFLKTVSKAALTATGSLLIRPLFPNIAPVLSASPETTDLFVVEGTDYRALVREGFKQMGGIQRFVKKGDSVVIKPNAAWSRTPEQAANTHPDIVAEVVRVCKEAGAGKVEVIEHPCDNYKSSFRISGFEEAVEKAGSRLYSLSETQGFSTVNLPEAKILKKPDVATQILNADCFINMPIAKSHGSARLTMAMKNHMGAVKDRRIFHTTDLDQCIADISSFLRPDLTIMDHTRVMTTRGPKGPGNVVILNKVVFGTDQVAIDAYGTSLFGMKPDDLGYLRAAKEMNLGITDLDKINIKNTKLSQ